MYALLFICPTNLTLPYEPSSSSKFPNDAIAKLAFQMHVALLTTSVHKRALNSLTILQIITHCPAET